MITEDYVSFETAKLLKEKGFDEQCTYMYNSQHKLYSTFEQCRQITRNNSDWIHYVGRLNVVPIAVPTLQMAMKWLREVHKLYVNVCPSVEGYYWTEKWHSYVENLEKRYPFGKFIGTFNSHEQACEAAIMYCLENLI